MNVVKFIKDGKGAAGLEFTLVFPLLLMITFGIIEVGSLMFDKAILTNAAREGTRAAITYTYEGSGTPTCDILYNEITPQVQQLVDRYMRNNLGNGNYFMINFDPNQTPDIYVDSPEPDGGSGEIVLPVRVGFNFNFILIDNIINFLTNGTFDDGIYMEAEARMRGEDNYRPPDGVTIPLIEYLWSLGC